MSRKPRAGNFICFSSTLRPSSRSTLQLCSTSCRRRCDLCFRSPHPSARSCCHLGSSAPATAFFSARYLSAGWFLPNASSSPPRATSTHPLRSQASPLRPWAARVRSLAPPFPVLRPTRTMAEKERPVSTNERNFILEALKEGAYSRCSAGSASRPDSACVHELSRLPRVLPVRPCDTLPHVASIHRGHPRSPQTSAWTGDSCSVRVARA